MNMYVVFARVCVLLMDVYCSLRLKTSFWMSGIFTVSIYHLSLSQSLPSSLFIIHMSHVRNVMSGSAAQVQLGWDFATLGKYFMLFAIIHQPEHTFITLLFFYKRINISGVCILKVLICVVERDCAYTSDWDSGNHLKRTLAVRGEIMRSLDYLKHCTCEAEVTCVKRSRVCMHDCAVLSGSWSAAD